jgi:hypothetical protein
MPKLVANIYLAIMLAISSLLFLYPDAQEEVILTIAVMGLAYGAIDHALRESD